jgi:hypothetical protein
VRRVVRRQLAVGADRVQTREATGAAAGDGVQGLVAGLARLADDTICAASSSRPAVTSRVPCANGLRRTSPAKAERTASARRR